MTRFLAAGMALLSVAGAPLQCGHDPDPNLRREDTAGDALWDLSERFHAEHNEAAARETLRYLVDRYPSNRHVAEARDKLSDGGA
jgi:hypothetical protein